MAVVFSGILFAVFNAALGGEASFKQLFAVVGPRVGHLVARAVFTG